MVVVVLLVIVVSCLLVFAFVVLPVVFCFFLFRSCWLYFLHSSWLSDSGHVGTAVVWKTAVSGVE